MKTFRLTGIKCAALCFLSLFLGMGAKKEDGLKDVAKPYIGVYVAERILFGGQDRTDEFSRLAVELKANGRFSLTAVDERGRKYSGGGSYVYEKEDGEITFRSSISYALSGGKAYLEHGTLRLIARYDDKLLIISFKR